MISSTVPSGMTGSRLDEGRWRSQLRRLASAFLTQSIGDVDVMSPAARTVPRILAASTRYAYEENWVSVRARSS